MTASDPSGKTVTSLHQPTLIPPTEITRRCVQLQQKLIENQMDGCLVVQRVDLLYFSGTAQDGVLYIPSQGEPILFIKRYLPRARSESALLNIVPIDTTRDIPGLIMDHYGDSPARLGLELDVIPVNEYRYYCQLFASANIMDASTLIMSVRCVKSSWEIKQMEQTAVLSAQTFEHMTRILAPGMTEMDFASQFEQFARKNGHAGKLRVRNHKTEGYSWHVLSGENGGKTGLLDSPASGMGTSYAFPCGAGYRRIEPKEPVMVDFACVLNGLHMDETRMFAIEAMPSKASKVSQAAIRIHQELMETIKPGMTAHDVFMFATHLAHELGYQKSFLGVPGYQVSFIGHGIGYELVEPPFIARGREEVLLPGMVFALEPKFTFKDQFCAGIESVFVLTHNGLRLISKIPVTVFVV